jgi:uncharacterized membrane protein YraQ (UPF0718 family)
VSQLTPEEAVSLFLIKFLAILWEAMPFIVLGAVLAGILEEFLPQQAITRFLPKQVVPAVMIGAVLGLIFPMCECGILVVMRRLLRKGLPLSCCIAYMLAGPVINVVVMISTVAAFEGHGIAPEMVGLRVGLAFLVASITGFIVHLEYKKHGNALLTNIAVPTAEVDASSEANTSPVKKTLGKRLANISGTAMHDFIDITLFLTLGAALAATAKLFISPSEVELLSRNQPMLAIPAMMFLAFLMCLCSEADAFVAASFTKMHISAKLGFLVLGPMLDIKLVMMYTRVFRRRLIITIATSVTLLVLFLCLLVHVVYQANGWTGLPGRG